MDNYELFLNEYTIYFIIAGIAAAVILALSEIKKKKKKKNG